MYIITKKYIKKLIILKIIIIDYIFIQKQKQKKK